MNIWEEKYPDDLNSTLNNAFKISKKIEVALKKEIKLSKLFETDKNRKMNRKALFSTLGVEANRSLNTKNGNNKICGIYVFAEKEKNRFKPLYVGISKAVIRRLRQHGWGKSHNQASFAYLRAKENEDYTGTRIKFPEKKLEKYRKEVQNLCVAVYPIDINEVYNLYFYEVAIAAILKSEWNSFKTH